MSAGGDRQVVPDNIHSSRMDALWSVLGKKVDAFIVTAQTDIRYLCGFAGSAGILLINASERLLISDFRYEEQAGQQSGHAVEVKITARGFLTEARRQLGKMRVMKLGFDSSMPYASYDTLRGGFGKMEPFTDPVLKLRSVKDEQEIEHIRLAVQRAEDAFVAIKPRIKAGVTERSIALRIEEKVKRLGSTKLPFDYIVASGENSSRPHAGATERKLAPGDLLTIDWGAEAHGYFSDMTRTFIVKGGRGLKHKKEIYDLVLRANEQARKAASVGMDYEALDAVARDVISEAGYGERFGHGLGHGVGLDVHELPRVSMHSRDKIGEMEVFTIEPGVYVAGLGGVRIEDMVVARTGGCEVLTRLPRALESI